MILQRQSKRRNPSSSLETVLFDGACDLSALKPIPSSTAQRAMTYSLLKSNSGQRLPVESNLKIIEVVVEEDPKSITILMSLSRDFRSLLKDYEYSIIKRIVRKYCTGYQVLASSIQPEYVKIPSMTYRWLSELSSRDTTTNYLIRHDISAIEIDGSWSALRPSNGDLADPDFAKKITTFKESAIQLLYQLADCTVGMRSRHTVRARQVEFLEELDKLELATLGCFIRALGLGYSKRTRAAVGVTDGAFATECMCVFENKLMRYGPFFAWSAVAGSPVPYMWHSLVIQQGLTDLQEFESGRGAACSSLQSVLWQLFCRKAECNSFEDGWTAALRIIGREIVS